MACDNLEHGRWVTWQGLEPCSQPGLFYLKCRLELHLLACLSECAASESLYWGSSSTVEQWDHLIEFIEPLQRAVLAVPPIALRADPGALFTAGRYPSCAYLHTCIPAYLHTCILACLHTRIPAYLHTRIPAYAHMHASRMHAYVCVCTGLPYAAA